LALPLLQSLKELGVSMSIDDFGTGYSSLAYLKRLPIDTLKIDRSFVRELETSGDSAAIVAAIIAMSKSLKLRVVAEGVETRGQMVRLAEEGCQLMQGWLFAKAVPADEFLRLLTDASRSAEWRLAAGEIALQAAARTSAAASADRAEWPAAHGNAVESSHPSVHKDVARRWANRFLGREA
jgi:predicted signal transduction protein with EAL and GGDEF domain